VDFTAEVERSMRVLDGAVAVFCAVAGVQPQSETVWRQATKYKVPRIAFVNKMDRTGANFFNALNDMRTKLRANAHPLYLPVGAEENFKGVIDLVRMKCYVWDESDPLGVKFNTSDPSGEQLVEAKKWRESLIEAVCDFDDVLAEKFLGGAEISEDELIVGIRKATLSLNFVGVIPGSAFKKKAVQPLQNANIPSIARGAPNTSPTNQE
jgi:elongation factor G